jgi:hypothetical protein
MIRENEEIFNAHEDEHSARSPALRNHQKDIYLRAKSMRTDIFEEKIKENSQMDVVPTYAVMTDLELFA